MSEAKSEKNDIFNDIFLIWIPNKQELYIAKIKTNQ